MGEGDANALRDIDAGAGMERGVIACRKVVGRAFRGRAARTTLNGDKRGIEVTWKKHFELNLNKQ